MSVHAIAGILAVVLLFGTTLFTVHARRRLEANRSLAYEKELDRSLFELTPHPMLALTSRGLVTRTNAAFREMIGRGEAMLESAAFADLFSPAGRRLSLLALRDALDGERTTVETSLPTREHVAEVELTTVPMKARGEVVGAYAIVRDVTDWRRLERELESRALHDYLTGLPNRALFQDRLDHALRRAQRGATRVAMLYVDLDKFKPVNDALGHAKGDQVLRVVASRLTALVRGADTVARLGGDEFAVLLESVESEEAAAVAADRFVATVRTPIVIDDQEVNIGASVGVAVSGNHEGPGDLVRQADLAMYEAKRRGGFQRFMYEAELENDHIKMSERLEGDLRRAIDRGELRVEYQPIVDVGRELLVGFEALLRWEHPELGRIPPSTFIDLAEASSLIAELDRWVLRTACRQLGELLRDGIARRPLKLSVNLSARHFEERDFVSAISDIILDTGFDPDDLQLELTESSAGGDADKVRRLKALGVKVAVDDFGTGYSSLGYLRDLDVDVLKVDRSFVLALGADPSSSAIVRTIITLAEILDLEVIIEGIEDEGQLALLEEMGGRYVQGYLFGRSVPASELPHLLASGFSRAAERGGTAVGPPPTGDPIEVDGREREVRPYLPPLGGGRSDTGSWTSRVRVPPDDP